MNLKPAKMLLQRFPSLVPPRVSLTVCWLLFIGCLASSPALAATGPATSAPPVDGVAGIPCFNVNAFTIEGRWVPSTNVLTSVFSKYAGTNVNLVEIIQAASDLELEYLREGYPAMNIVIAPKHITNGIVTLNVFPGAVPQIVVAGRRYPVSDDEVALAMHRPLKPKTPPAAAVASATNAGPHFTVSHYQVNGNTLLPRQFVDLALTNVAAAYGTNVTFEKIRDVMSQLQGAYRARGFVTVAVDLPPQKLTNATVNLQVVEGRLHAIAVKGNYFFSSNNVMRAIPGLSTNMMLNGITLQAEMNRANANPDRQITTILEPGPEPGTSDLTLQVKDRLPLHAKAELNDESSPGTPDMRLNTSATYNNLWNYEHQMGVQYSFTPWDYKKGSQWEPYDVPLVANYSAFYRLPIGYPEAIDETIAASPGSFGYSEATRKFVLPPSSGQADLTFFASRSSIDTGLETLSSSVLYNVPGVRTITQQNIQEDLTVNNDLGVRFNAPIASTESTHWTLTGGIDFKTFETTSAKTNVFLFDEITLNANGIPNPPVISRVNSPVPLTDRPIDYLPVNLGFNGNWHEGNSIVTWALVLTGNLWHSGTVSNLDGITGSAKSTGQWIVVTPSASYQFQIYSNWQTMLRADGQIVNQPMISVEQFGIGGVNSVRGYHEGEVFGDDGWHVSFEQLTPPHTVGMVFGHTPLVLRGSVYMDYAHTYTLFPAKGESDGTPLWGTGVGCVASIGNFWETRFWFSLPLLKCSTATAYEPYFNFALTAQF
ncbi:MAG: POTRA domain-containing protein [Verrucomicrobiota bacterium]